MKYCRYNKNTIYSKESSSVAYAVCSDGKSIESERRLFESKCPHHCCGVLWPVPNCVKKKSLSYQGKFLDFSFYNAILIMSTYCVECNCLIRVLNCIVKSFICKAPIISSVGFDRYSSVICKSLEGCFCQQYFVQDKVSHEYNVYKI